MVETITPAVHGGGRWRWGISVALHGVGAALSAATLGAALGGAGALLGAPWGAAGAYLIAGLAAIYLLRESTGVGVPVPEGRRQVPDWWRTFFGPRVSALLYGLGLGVGFFTYLSHGTFVVVAAAALAWGSPVVGAVLLAPFGLARAVTVLAAKGIRGEEEATRLIDRLAELGRSPLPRIANGLALLAVAVVSTIVGARAGTVRAGPVVAAALAVTFAWAAAGKVMRFEAWGRALAGYRLPSGIERATRALVPAGEAAVPALVAAGAGAMAASWSLVLLAAFSAAVLRARRIAGDRLPCGCFGTDAALDYRAMLARNAALALAAAVVVLFPDTVATAGGLAAPRAGELLPALLVGAGALLVVRMTRGLVELSRGVGR